MNQLSTNVGKVLHTEMLWKISLKITNLKAVKMTNNITMELTEIM